MFKTYKVRKKKCLFERQLFARYRDDNIDDELLDVVCLLPD